MAAFIFLGAIVVIVLWYFVSKEFQHIAETKGFSEEKYFWWTFLVGLAGILMVIALPQKVEVPETAIPDELPDL